uniref:Uncharacterized protein n=1 Tax=Anopheles farauti TaxID=69004 RepID=A0A182QBA8_9DIPT
MQCYVRSSLLCLVALLVRAGTGNDGIEKVSYLLQYGPGVHTVFEQENPPKQPVPVSDGKDKVAPSTTPSTLTSKGTTGTVMEVAKVTHSVVSRTSSTDPTVSQRDDPPEGSSSTGSASATPNITDDGSMASGNVRRRNHAGTPQLCHTSTVSVLEQLHPLPLPPTLPTFGANLRSDVVVNLKPKELRTLMSTYIALIEAYKAYNQQQRRNIAHLEEELARYALITARAERLRNTKLQLQREPHTQASKY